MSDNTMWWLALGLIVVGGAPSVPWGAGWVWPVPPAKFPDGVMYPGVITNGYVRGKHAGVDIMYARRAPGDRIDAYPKGADGTAAVFAPPETPIVAARDGRVWSVDKSPRGWEVVIDHGAPFATYYQHLSHVAFAPHARGVNLATGKSTAVRAGEQIGRMGADPLDPEGLRHLHFAVWFKGSGDGASVDPASAMRSWSQAPQWEVA